MISNPPKNNMHQKEMSMPLLIGNNQMTNASPLLMNRPNMNNFKMNYGVISPVLPNQNKNFNYQIGNPPHKMVAELLMNTSMIKMVKNDRFQKENNFNLFKEKFYECSNKSSSKLL